MKVLTKVNHTDYYYFPCLAPDFKNGSANTGILLTTLKLSSIFGIIADRVYQEEIMKACHQGMGSLQESRVFAGHFGRDKFAVMVVTRWYFLHIFK